MFGPQAPDCRMVMVHHIDSGTMEGQRLDNTTVVTVLPSQRDLTGPSKKRFKAAIYVDKSLPSETQQLLVRLFTTKSVRTGKQLLATPATVRFHRTASGFRTEVPGYLVAETKARLGRDGKQLVVHNVPFAEGSTWRVGENVTVQLNEPLAGWKWNLTGRNGTWTIWNWEKGKGHQSIDPQASHAAQTAAATSCACCR